ncbi:MAG: VCBS repeat-containing protein [bacterium]
MVSGDLNGDGIEDFAVSTFRKSTLYTYLVHADGSISHAGRYELGTNTSYIDLGELNGDNFPDIVAVDCDIDKMFVLFGNGDGTMNLANIYDPGDRPQSATISDVNNDGFGDIIAGTLYSRGFRIYYGDGQGDFPETEFISTNATAGAFSQVWDFDNDGYKDLVLSGNDRNGGTPFFGIFKGDAGGFTPTQVWREPYRMAAHQLLDLNTDGYMDILVKSSPDGSGWAPSTRLRALINQGDGTFDFGDKVDVGLGHIMAKADLDNDGDQDIALTNREDPTLRVFRSNGKGWFEPMLEYPMPDVNDGVITLDLNQDKTPDILVSIYKSPGHREVIPVYNHNYWQFPDSKEGQTNAGKN